MWYTDLEKANSYPICVDPTWWAQSVSHTVYIDGSPLSGGESLLSPAPGQYSLVLDPATSNPTNSLQVQPGNKVISIRNVGTYPNVNCSQPITAGIADNSQSVASAVYAGPPSWEFSVILKDKYGNICNSGEHVNVQIMANITVTNIISDHDEEYVCSGITPSFSSSCVCPILNWASGPSLSFTVSLPAIVDTGDGFNLQLFIDMNENSLYDIGTDITLGTPLSFTQ